MRDLFTYCLLIVTVTGFAQSHKRTFRQRELGLFAGTSYYIGDINPRGHFKAMQPAAGAYFRYTTNYRYAFRFGLNYGKITGNDAASGEADQIERNLSFSSVIYEANAIAEFNFVEYRISHDRHRFTVFIFAGLGAFYFNPTSNSGTALRDQNSEGQNKAYPKVQVCLPFGLGLKWNIGDRCGMGIEWGPRRTFTDYLDDIHGTYPASSTGESGGTSTEGNMRGNPSTRDSYFYCGLTFNFKLPDPYRTCHGVGKRKR